MDAGSVGHALVARGADVQSGPQPRVFCDVTTVTVLASTMVQAQSTIFWPIKLSQHMVMYTGHQCLETRLMSWPSYGRFQFQWNVRSGGRTPDFTESRLRVLAISDPGAKLLADDAHDFTFSDSGIARSVYTLNKPLRVCTRPKLAILSAAACVTQNGTSKPSR